jgi:uncharacterized protein (DUF1697 family)
MGVAVAMVRGINVGGYRKVRMEALRGWCEALGLRDVQTYVQSGNLVFRTAKRDLEALRKQIEDAIERGAGFRADIVLRTTAELRGVVARNPFAGRADVEPRKLAVTFLAGDPGEEARAKLRAIPAAPEELRVEGRELYIHFPNGMGRPKLSMPLVERTLRIPATSRNWNTVTMLLEMAEKLEAGA